MYQENAPSFFQSLRQSHPDFILMLLTSTIGFPIVVAALSWI